MVITSLIPSNMHTYLYGSHVNIVVFVIEQIMHSRKTVIKINYLIFLYIFERITFLQSFVMVPTINL